MPIINFNINKEENYNSRYRKRECYNSLYEIPKRYGIIKKTKYNHYWVTDKGFVIGFSSSDKKFTILKPSCDKYGYCHVVVIENRKRHTITIHRLVLSTFNPINNMYKYQVNHIDENKSNNCLYNLEWITAKENMAYSNGKHVECRIFKTNEFVGSYISTREAARQLKLQQGEIINVINRRRNQRHTKGYTFNYV